MGHKKRTVLVLAKDDPAMPGKVLFEMSGFGVAGDRIECKKDDPKEPMGEDEPHKVVFELVDNSSQGLRFADEDEVMWVGKKNDLAGCPAEGSKQEHVVKVKDVDGDQLTVRNYNKNNDKGEYKFALNFVGSDGRSHCYDPIWDERNGAHRR